MRIRDAANRVAAACASALGFVPTITTGARESDDEPSPLDYRIDKLVAAGYRPGASLDAELRRTLLAARAIIDAGGTGI